MAPKGVIIVSLGQRVSFSAMPVQLKQSFMDAFAKLTNYRIFVYTDDVDAMNVTVPSNVNMTRWFPQNELLGEIIQL
jgi:hypothetical protein